MIIVDAVHEDDLQGQRGGPWKSVQLHVDPDQKKVVKELAYQ